MSNGMAGQPAGMFDAIEERLVDSMNNMDHVLKWVNNNSDLFVGYALNIISALIIIIVGMIIARFISSLVFKLLKRKNIDSTVSNFIAHMARYIIVALVLIAALSKVGVQTTSFIALIGAAGLAVGLALQGSLSNFASGILIVILRPFKVGEYIEVSGILGTVETVQIFATTIVTIDNKSVVIPNSAILSGNIINYSRKPTRRIDLLIGVSYGADLAQTKKVLETVLLANHRVLKSPEIQVAVAELGNSSVNLVVRPWVKTADYWSVRFELIEAIKNGLDEANIEIPFPQMDVHTKK